MPSYLKMSENIKISLYFNSNKSSTDKDMLDRCYKGYIYI